MFRGSPRSGAHVLLGLALVCLVPMVFMSKKVDVWIVPKFQEAELLVDQPVVLSESNMSSTTSMKSTVLFDLQDPVWPKEKPQARTDCKVVFKDTDLQLCHISPFKGGNFGDELGPPIMKRILELYFGCSAQDLPTYDLIDMRRMEGGMLSRTRNCLMTVGSMWRMVITGDHLWGTGVATTGTILHRCVTSQENSTDRVSNLTIYSSRGPRSKGATLKNCPWAKDLDFDSAGDAGYLVPYLFPDVLVGTDPPRKEYCVMPHAQEEKHKAFRKVPEDLRLTARKPWQNVTRDLMGCQQVVSSSLHGVILSEALRIPVRRLRVSFRPGDLKFEDFYESLRGAEPSPTNNMTLARETMLQPQSVEEGDLYARRILKSFPIHLFGVEYADTYGKLSESPLGSAHLSITTSTE